jgi:hypothetical protein
VRYRYLLPRQEQRNDQKRRGAQLESRRPAWQRRESQRPPACGLDREQQDDRSHADPRSVPADGGERGRARGPGCEDRDPGHERQAPTSSVFAAHSWRAKDEDDRCKGGGRVIDPGSAEDVPLADPRQEKRDEQSNAEDSGDRVDGGPGPAEFIPSQREAAEPRDRTTRHSDVEAVGPARVGRDRVSREAAAKVAQRVHFHGDCGGEIRECDAEAPEGEFRGELWPAKGGDRS